MFLTVEFIYDAFVAIAIPVGYKMAGLTGTGIALSVAGFVDMLVIHLTHRWKYGFKFSFTPMPLYLAQFVLLVSCIVVSFSENPMIKWTIGPVCVFISAAISLYILNREMNIISKIMNKVKKGKDNADQ